ncbi:NUDIX domain-containing protein, partial [Vibrio cholerae]|nr:NUDIX domain-containing protein [Vibrio cholerae]
MNKVIDKLAWVLIQDGKLLAVRSKGKALFYLPGGKREAGENDEEALIREIKEELSVDLSPTSLK